MNIFTPELVTGLISLGSGAFAGLMANNQKMLLASIEATKSFNQMGNANANDAAKRAGKSFLQPVVGIIIILVAFLSLYLVAISDIPVSYIYEEARGKFLGFIGSGQPKVKVIEAHGLVLPPYVKYSVISVVNFLFGASVVKLRRV